MGSIVLGLWNKWVRPEGMPSAQVQTIGVVSDFGGSSKESLGQSDKDQRKSFDIELEKNLYNTFKSMSR
jgi:hypothetical protein